MFSEDTFVENDFIDLQRVYIKSSLSKLITVEMMKRYTIIPLDLNGEKLCIAVCQNYDNKTIEDIKVLTQKEIVIYTAKKEQILSAIEELESRYNTMSLVKQFEKDQEKTFIETNLLNKNNADIEGSPVVKFVNLIISQALKRNASDIHIEPLQDSVIVRFRIDGILSEYTKIPKDIYNSVCTRLKIKSGMDIGEKRLPQDGKMELDIENNKFDLRVSSLPTINGEKIAIRILYKSDSLLSLKALGFHSKDREFLLSCLEGGSGLILLCGPTGSGKTTTLYALLNQINKRDKNITTIEDPVEYVLPLINQVNVNVKAGLSFASGLRSVLRQDPNVIMVGEIRDEETAQIAIRAAITGHLVLSTLHTNDAASTILRLTDMGIPRYLVADSLNTCVSQRLVRKICQHCKTEYVPAAKELINLNLAASEKLYKGRGCIRCNGSGYSGRTAVYEIVNFDDSLRRLVVRSKNIEELKNYNEGKGVKSIKVSCRELVVQGITTYQEYLKLCSCDLLEVEV